MQQLSKSKHILAVLGIILSVSGTGLMFSTINTILAVIKNDLNASIAQLQWIINIYGIFIASSLVVMGRLADKFGRKRVFLIGIILLTIAMLGSGLSPSANWLIIFEALFGWAGAILLPVSQILIINLYSVSQRSKAMGIWTSSAGLALGAGPIIGGIVAHILGWRWIFLLIASITLITFVLVLCCVPDMEREHSHPSLDLPGAISLTLCIACFVIATVQHNLWSYTAIITFYVLSIIALILLLYIERRASNPIIRAELFTNRNFLCASIINALLLFFGWSGFFLIPYCLQTIMNYSVLQAGYVMLLVTIPIGILSPISGRLYSKLGPKLLIAIGFLCLLASVTFQLQFNQQASIAMVLIGTLCFGLGWGVAWGPSASAALASLPAGQAGVAAGSFTTLQEIGGTVGLAITASVARGHSDFLAGYHEAMWVLGLFSLIGLGVALGITKIHPHTQSKLS